MPTLEKNAQCLVRFPFVNLSGLDGSTQAVSVLYRYCHFWEVTPDYGIAPNDRTVTSRLVMRAGTKRKDGDPPTRLQGCLPN